MPSRRELIQMTDSEIRDFLEAQKTIIICSVGPGGYPHPMPMWFAVDDDGTVRMTTFRKSQKVLNVQRDPRVTLLAEDGVEYSKLRGVTIQGRCEVVDDAEAVTDTLVAINKDAVGDTPEALAGMRKAVAGTATKRVCLLVRPDKILSWDHRKLEGRY